MLSRKMFTLLLGASLILSSSNSLASIGANCADYSSYSFGNPSAEEQIHLELINRARANPTAEAKLYKLSSVTEGVTNTDKMSTSAMQPLTFNAKLYAAALAHSKDMANNEYFDHTSQGTGKSPATRIKDAGYNYSRVGENLAFTASSLAMDQGASSIKMHGDLFIDRNYPGRGHRVNILTPEYKEIGVGLAFGLRGRLNAYYVTGNFAASRDSQCHFITGVVYDDKDNDKFYSVGEGLSNVQIKVDGAGNSTTKTSRSGGYGVPVQNGTYKVTFIHSTLGNYSQNITVKDKNIKLDVLASKLASGSISVPDPSPSLPVSVVNIADNSLSIQAMEADGFSEKFDVNAKYISSNSMDTATLQSIHAKVQLITKMQGSALDMTIFAIDSLTPVTSTNSGAKYTPPSFVQVYELHVKEGSNLLQKLEVMFIYVEAGGKGYLVVYGTKNK
jgi:uncharacterized protein YkwD